MKGLSWILLVGMLLGGLLAGCTGWEVKPPGEQPTSSQEQPTPRGGISIGGEEGGRGR